MIYILIFLTLIPSILIGLFVYYKDKYEKEPLSLIFRAFLFGCLAVIPSIIIEQFFMFIQLDKFDIFLFAFIGIALVEEGSKFFFLKKFLFPHKEFNEPFDGIIYAVMISLGFATVENFMYVFGSEDSFYVAFIRMFSAVPLHAACGVIMGYYVGEAKFEDNRANLLLFMAVLVATALHAFYDYFLLIDKIKIGSAIALLIGIFYSFRAMRSHQQKSPFK